MQDPNILAINTIKCIGVQMVNDANSGHPGIILGAAPFLFVLFKNHLNFNPQDPQWINRDRFILSAGHGSALLYTILHLSGYRITLEDLKNFRKIGYVTTGHPEYNITYGIEATTGPLGSGIAMSVGVALAELKARIHFNQPNHHLINHYTFVLCSDGDLQEGIAQESISLAGHWKLNKLIWLYDSNDVQLDSSLNKTQSDDVKKRFQAAHWNYLKVADGNNLQAIDKAIAKAKKSLARPTLIEIKTIIGEGATFANHSKVHGSPLKEDISQVYKFYNYHHAPYVVDKTVNQLFYNIIQRNQQTYLAWHRQLKAYQLTYPILYASLMDYLACCYKINWQIINDLSIEKTMPTRQSVGKILDSITNQTNNFIGGSADLSCSTMIKGSGGDFDATNHPSGNNLMFGVREFAMFSIINGITLHGIFKGYAATFLVFADYAKAALRLGCLMKLAVINIFSHDSILVGEDGPTHQPIEQLASLRGIPNLHVMRPCDWNESVGCLIAFFEQQIFPMSIITSRQSVVNLDSSQTNAVMKGGYIISSENMQQPLDLIFLATGSEVSLALAIKSLLTLNIRVLSMPCLSLFDQQSRDYITNLLPHHIKKVAIELSNDNCWYKYVGCEGLVLGVYEFGLSGSIDQLTNHFKFTAQHLSAKINHWFIK